jgi:hypothetical protein
MPWRRVREWRYRSIFLTSALDGSQWSALRPGRFTSCTYCVGSPRRPHSPSGRCGVRTNSCPCYHGSERKSVEILNNILPLPFILWPSDSQSICPSFHPSKLCTMFLKCMYFEYSEVALVSLMHKWRFLSWIFSCISVCTKCACRSNVKCHAGNVCSCIVGRSGKLLLALVSTVILVSGSYWTHDYVCVSRRFTQLHCNLLFIIKELYTWNLW